MFFWKKERQVRQEIDDYLAETERCAEAFQQGIEIFLANGVCEQFEELVQQTHRHEGTADAKRRGIEASMYHKALIPESRGDVLGMLEAIDLVPNQCESVLYQIWTENPEVPQIYAERFRQIVGPNVQAHVLLCRGMRDLFAGARRVRDLAQDVYENERASDRLERALIREIFASDIDKADKILLRELVIRIGEISDRAENAMDRLVLVSAKRQS